MQPTLQKLQQINSNLAIKPVSDPGFARYGRVVNGLGGDLAIAYARGHAAPGSGVVYEPAVPGLEADTTDTLKLTDLAAGWYAVRNVRLGVGFGMSWPLAVFPALWFWQSYGGAYGAPWYGRTYLIALEPFSTARPTIADAMEDGTARIMRPGETLEASYLAAAFEGTAEVAGIAPDGRITRRQED